MKHSYNILVRNPKRYLGVDEKIKY